MLCFAVFTTVFGYISDYISPYILPRIGAALLIVFSYVLFYELQHLGPAFLWFIVSAISICGAMINSSYVILIRRIFPASLRYSGFGLSYSLGFAIFSGLAPLTFTWLIQHLQLPEAPGIYITLCAIMTLVATKGLSSIDTVAIHQNKDI